MPSWNLTTDWCSRVPATPIWRAWTWGMRRAAWRQWCRAVVSPVLHLGRSTKAIQFHTRVWCRDETKAEKMDFSRGDWNTGRLGIDNVKNVRHSKERKEMCEAFITHPCHGLTTPPIHPLAIYICMEFRFLGIYCCICIIYLAIFVKIIVFVLELVWDNGGNYWPYRLHVMEETTSHTWAEFASGLNCSLLLIIPVQERVDASKDDSICSLHAR
jgi:hypothetical protein